MKKGINIKIVDWLKKNEKDTLIAIPYHVLEILERKQ